MMREDGSKEARVKEAHLKKKEELEGGEVREEMCRPSAEVGRGGVACERECVIEWVNDVCYATGQGLYTRLAGEKNNNSVRIPDSWPNITA